MTVQEDIDQLLDQVVKVTDMDRERARELFDQTADTIESRSQDDRLIRIESRTDAELVAISGVLLLSRDSDDGIPFEDRWEKFSTEMTAFDIGLMYAIALSDKAEKSLEEIHNKEL